MKQLSQSPAWRALQQHAAGELPPLKTLLSEDPARAESMHLAAGGLELNFARQRIKQETLQLLLDLAEQQAVAAAIAALFEGAAVNVTEQRPALHMALRAPAGADFMADGQPVMPAVLKVRAAAYALADAVIAGEWRGFRGDRITDVVNLGIGGSDLGPRMVCRALGDAAPGPRLHFVSNVDGADLSPLLATLDPASTLWIVTSKSFGTQETMRNAQAARRWFLQTAGAADIARHFVAVSTNREAAAAFGIHPDNIFGFWNWVGGRYSLWSAVGLPIMMRLGSAGFDRLLQGAHGMDNHFRSAPLQENLPVLMALLALWNRNFQNASSQVVAPYDQRLEFFPAWLQQLEMESNGKGVDRSGQPVAHATTPPHWGGVGTNAQHAYFQMLHQAPEAHPVDFILAAQADHALEGQHEILIANMLAQAEALAWGKDAASVRQELQQKGLTPAALEAAVPHRIFPGNRPSNLLLLPRLDPNSLGALLAAYEHRTYVLSVLWDINAFDQWGVELGKQIADRILARMQDGSPAPDAVTRKLLQRIRD